MRDNVDGLTVVFGLTAACMFMIGPPKSFR